MGDFGGRPELHSPEREEIGERQLCERAYAMLRAGGEAVRTGLAAIRF